MRVIEVRQIDVALFSNCEMREEILGFVKVEIEVTYCERLNNKSC